MHSYMQEKDVPGSFADRSKKFSAFVHHQISETPFHIEVLLQLTGLFAGYLMRTLDSDTWQNMCHSCLIEWKWDSSCPRHFVFP